MRIPRAPDGDVVVMGIRDEAMLSEAERAALAGLESKAEADDPRLAAQLRGRRRRRPALKVPPGIARASSTPLGPAVAAVGLLVTVAALSFSVVVALIGAIALVVGLVMSSVLVSARVERRRLVAPGPRLLRSDGSGEGPFTNAG